MPKLRKQDVANIDVDELEGAEYSEGSFQKYDGEIPPNDTVLRAYVKSIWWTVTSNDDPMLKVLVVADDNEDDLEEYNGLPMWENMALTTGAKFKWAPFFEQFGISIRDIKADSKGNSRVIVAAEDDNMGAPIEKIGSFTPGSDESWCRVVIAREKYDGKLQAHVGGWLDYEADDEEEEPAEPDEDEAEETDEEPEEEDTEDTEEEEEEEEPAKSARGRRTAAKASKPAPASSPRGTARKAAPSRSAPAKGKSPTPVARGRGKRSSAGSDDVPF